MKRTKKQVKADYKLDTSPSDRLMALIEQAGDITQADLDAAAPSERMLSDPVTPEQIVDTVRGTILAQSVGELLESARKSSGLTMQQLGEAVGVSRGRINQIENPEANLELATLARLAAALDARLEVRLIPKDPEKKPLVAHLG